MFAKRGFNSRGIEHASMWNIHIEALELNHLLQIVIPEWHFASSENFRFSASVGPLWVPRALTFQRNSCKTARKFGETAKGSLDAKNQRFLELTWNIENKVKGDLDNGHIRGNSGTHLQKFYMIY